MRKENKNRLTKELDNGKFKMTIGNVMEDLNLSKSKAERMIRYFEDMGIIKAVVKGNLTKGYSIYEYVTESSYKIHDEKDFEKCFENINDNENIDNKDIEKCDDINTIGDNFNEVNLDNFEKDFEKYNEKDFMNSKIDNTNIYLNNIYTNVVDYLNMTTKKRFRKDTPKTRKLIKTRLKEGFAEEDFYKVIDVKASQWLNSDMEKFLRPETLFSNKFEGYLNEVVDDNKEFKKVEVEIFEPKGYWDIDFEF
ncbi:MAG: conserved phage C-terminal domain-containing protein [Bacilli bacterium]|nr:conserved phage C-terminal domain-containing protein [Bacilli bacterium]